MVKTKREKIESFFNGFFITLIMLGLFFLWRNLLVVVPLVYALAALETGSETLMLYLPRFIKVWFIMNLVLLLGIFGYVVNNLLSKRKMKGGNK